MGPSAKLGFNGVAHEPGTRWQLLGNGYRAYNPVLMRFQSPDSMSPLGRGGINAYAYCGNDAINRIDPNGHFFQYLPSMLLGAGAAAAIVGAVVADDTPAKVGSAAAAAALLIAAVGVFSMTQPTVRKWLSGEFRQPPSPRPRAPSESPSALNDRLRERQWDMFRNDPNNAHFLEQDAILGRLQRQPVPAPVRPPSNDSNRAFSGVSESNAHALPDLVTSNVANTNARPNNVIPPQADSSTTFMNRAIRDRAVSIGSGTLSLRDM